MTAGLTIVTSLAAPITFPLVVGLVVQESIEVSFTQMMISLAVTIFVPMVLAQGMKNFCNSVVKRWEHNISSINVLLLFILVYLPVASQQESIIESSSRLVWQLVAMFAVFLAMHGLGFLLVPRAKFSDKLTSVITLAYMNIALSLVIAAEFFSDEIVIIVVFSYIPWVMYLGPFKAAITWHTS